MRRRLLSTLLALCMALALLPSMAFVAEATSGSCGDNVTWAFNNGTLTISGNGAMQDYYSPDELPWYNWRDQIKTVTISDGVTSIGFYAFGGCPGLTSVTIPNSIISIGEQAFFCCAGLISVTIPASVTNIGKEAFFSCTSLTEIRVDTSNQNYTSVDGILFTKDTKTLITYPGGKRGPYTIPNSVTNIGDYAFCNCTSLTNITIPNSVVSIGDDAFFHCSSLASATIPNSVANIGHDAFSNCTGLTSVNIPDSVTSIGSKAFSGCTGLTSVTISSSVTEIDAFYGCTGLTSVTIPNSVTKIGMQAFDGCTSLTSVSIPNSVTDIEMYAFLGCTGLTSVTIPDSVTEIGLYAFGGCTGLTSVTIPNSLPSIIGGVFENCTGLKDVYYTGTKEQWEAIYTSGYNDDLKSATIHYNNTASPQPPQPTKFTDVPSDQWYFDSVAWAVEQGITNGTTPTTFSPNQSCTEIQILTFLWRAAGKPVANTALPTAVTGADDYISAAKWAYSKGMIDASFKQDTPCTRARAVMFMWQAAGSTAASGSSFTDAATDADYAQAVSWAVSRGVTAGTSATTFSPDKVCNRGEIVTFLYRDYGIGNPRHNP